ncbi:hypothetical protein C1752_17393 [Acaryochloris thomasi RCC1774]|uniref:PRC-barrel domain-containing protein n=1 Tax=Acaryochloris thomasi RCC1774 TaxID=1764569 RepID=A0A2W1J681_9CYAN|nr:photosystem reaction center subunit H [Acaryochloris thomasi]PZD70163.1 hypothetical protein C1752_17393 [Acaryochloris thomasi RCC1774]
MLSVIRRSQIIGATMIDSTTASKIGTVEDLWIDELRRVKYLFSQQGYCPLDQISGVNRGVVSIYSHLLSVTQFYIHHSAQIAVQSKLSKPLGWVEDFLFDWHTGEIVAYLLAGDIASSYGGRAILFPKYIAEYRAGVIHVDEDTKHCLQDESKGLEGFLCERSDPVQSLVQEMIVRLHGLIASDDYPESVRLKIKQVSEDLAADYDHHILQEATEFLHEQWANLQQSIDRSIRHAQAALKTAWEDISSKKQK